jgi:branched-chain amino acid transport system substrate-binding protein
MPKKFVLIATVFLLCMGVVIAPALADSYKVGAVFSVTGRASFLGDPEKKTAVMLADEINKAGGINGKKLEGGCAACGTIKDPADFRRCQLQNRHRRCR